jgi:hypothetical protein
MWSVPRLPESAETLIFEEIQMSLGSSNGNFSALLATLLGRGGDPTVASGWGIFHIQISAYDFRMEQSQSLLGRRRYHCHFGSEFSHYLGTSSVFELGSYHQQS